MDKCFKTHKKIYLSKTKAQQFIDHIPDNGIRNETGFLRPYYCEFCNHWHVTKMSEEEFNSKFNHEQINNPEFIKYLNNHNTSDQ